MSPIRFAAIVVCLLGTAEVARSGVVFIDPMTVELTPSDCLPVTRPRVATWGAWCDAPSCPPGTVTPDTDCQCGDQEDFGSALAGPARTTQVWAFDFTTSVYAQVDPVARRMVCVTSGGLASDLTVMYSDAVHARWECDLVALGASAIDAVVDGDASPSNPLFLELWILSRSGIPHTAAGEVGKALVRIEAPGTYRIPFESLLGSSPDSANALDLRRVTDILFRLGQCPEVPCEQPGYPAATYSLGPLTLVTSEPTPTRRTSWGRVKQAYR